MLTTTINNQTKKQKKTKQKKKQKKQISWQKMRNLATKGV
jgi:hypothetical protein